MARLHDAAVGVINVPRLGLRDVGSAVPVLVHVFERGEAGAGVVAVAADIGIGAVGEAVGFAFQGAPGGDGGGEDGVAECDVLR